MRETHRNNVVQSSDHVSEHLFFFASQLCHQFDHFTRPDVRHLESLAQLVVLVQNSAPGKQVDDSEFKVRS